MDVTYSSLGDMLQEAGITDAEKLGCAFLVGHLIVLNLQNAYAWLGH